MFHMGPIFFSIFGRCTSIYFLFFMQFWCHFFSEFCWKLSVVCGRISSISWNFWDRLVKGIKTVPISKIHESFGFHSFLRKKTLSFPHRSCIELHVCISNSLLVFPKTLIQWALIFCLFCSFWLKGVPMVLFCSIN